MPDRWRLSLVEPSYYTQGRCYYILECLSGAGKFLNVCGHGTRDGGNVWVWYHLDQVYRFKLYSTKARRVLVATSKLMCVPFLEPDFVVIASTGEVIYNDLPAQQTHVRVCCHAR